VVVTNLVSGRGVETRKVQGMAQLSNMNIYTHFSYRLKQEKNKMKSTKWYVIHLTWDHGLALKKQETLCFVL
jgi:hypothetical protein